MSAVSALLVAAVALASVTLLARPAGSEATAYRSSIEPFAAEPAGFGPVVSTHLRFGGPGFRNTDRAGPNTAAVMVLTE